MKKIIFIFVILLNAFLLSSCGQVIYSEGFDHISDGGSSINLYMGTTKFYNTFKEYNYIDGNYYYYDNFWDSEKVVLYLQFEEEDYWKAKEYLFENFNLWDEPIKEYNDYVFYLNKDYVDYSGNSETNKYYDYWYYGFPDEFNTYCYNDRNFTLMMVCYWARSKRKERDLAKDEFGKFLEAAFGKYYDFNQ